MLFLSIQYAFVVYMVGLPTRINKTSLSEEPFISIAVRECSYKGACVPAFASSCFHYHGDYVSAEKKFSFPPIPLCHESRDFLYVYDLVYSLGEFLAPPLLKITFCILSCRERSWHWPVKASGRIRSWNVEESSINVSVFLEEVKGTIPHLCLNEGWKTNQEICAHLYQNEWAKCDDT